MQPTLSDSDQILVNTHIYDFSSPTAGDIVVFDPVQSKRQQAIKRVIGLPGEKITLRRSDFVGADKSLNFSYRIHKYEK